MIRPSIPMRESLARLTLPFVVMGGFALLLLGRADAPLAERARMALADAMTPAFELVAMPLAAAHSAMDALRDLQFLRADNARLRAENEQLLRWQAAAVALDAENATLKETLHWVSDPAASFVTARVVADAGGCPSGATRASPRGRLLWMGRGWWDGSRNWARAAPVCCW